MKPQSGQKDRWEVSVNVRKLILPTGLLPDCPNERRSRLDAYFADLLASVRAVPEGWEIDLNWPSTADYYVDPCVEQGLAWWRAGTHITEIHRQVRNHAGHRHGVHGNQRIGRVVAHRKCHGSTIARVLPSRIVGREHRPDAETLGADGLGD